jgi:hypothetical protein
MITRPSLTALLLAIILPVPVLASDANVSAYSNSQGSFTIMGYNLNRVVEAEIRIGYRSENPIPPSVSGVFLDRKTTTLTSQVAGGSIDIKIVCTKPCKRPFSGNSPFAIANIEGTVNSLTALLRYENGTTESTRVSITNPTSEQVSEQVAVRQEKERLEAEKARLEKERLDAEVALRASQSSVAAGAGTGTAGTDVPSSSQSGGSRTSAPAAGTLPAAISVTDQRRSVTGAGKNVTPAPESGEPEPETGPSTATRPAGGSAVEPRLMDEAERTISFSRRGSVQERFHGFAGDKSPASLARLFERSDDMFTQEPPLLLSDGSATLSLTVRIRKRSEQAPQFFISEATCTDLKIGTNDGVWVLELIPRAGSLAASVTVLSGNEMIDFPLAVAPPLEMFDEELAGVGETEYVRAANRLVSGR